MQAYTVAQEKHPEGIPKSTEIRGKLPVYSLNTEEIYSPQGGRNSDKFFSFSFS
jgi:hypothetical protein